ncbi:MAG: DMT family transporter [Planctomycetota bacterium]
MLDSGPFAPYIGPAAGVVTSFLWSFTALFFTAAGKRLGAATVNAVRIGMAVVLLGVTHRLLFGAWIPPAQGRQVLYLALSGLIGLSVGDLALFTAFVRVGPRVSMLIMTTAPMFAALFGWVILRESLPPLAWVGMALTIGGVCWVVLERPSERASEVAGRRAGGLILALIASACQAAGLLLSKQGIGHGWLPAGQHLNPQAATLIRMFFAGIFVLPTVAWLVARHRLAHPLRSEAADRRRRLAGYLFALCGATVGPFLGVWMSLIASDRAPLAVAQTTMSLAPVFILPWVVLFHKERLSRRAVLGALVAVGGVALLFPT